MREILRRLTRDVEMAIRIALAQRLADDTNAPHDLILLLVDDTIEVARPLILRSPLLTEKDALRLVAEGRRRSSGSRGRTRPYRHSGHRRAGRIAKRNRFWSRWCATPPPGFPRTPIRPWWRNRAPSPVCRNRWRSRADLPIELANRMCAWVSDALKIYITRTIIRSRAKRGGHALCRSRRCAQPANRRRPRTRPPTAPRN